MWVRIPLRQGVFDKKLGDKVCQWLATGRWFSPGAPVSSTKKKSPRYNWNIVESGVKHHKPNQTNNNTIRQSTNINYKKQNLEHNNFAFNYFCIFLFFGKQMETQMENQA